MEDKNFQEARDRFEREQNLAHYDGEDRVIPSSEYLEEAGEFKPSKMTPSGIAKLDSLIGGFSEGELITISGPPKNGKTTWAHTLTKNFEMQGVKSLWFSFEVTYEQMFNKFVIAQGIWVPRRLQPRNIEWIRDRIIESKAKFETCAVFIDHLHYLADIERMSRSSSLEIGTVIRSLKTLAVELHIMIFVMAHMTKTRYDEMPTEEALRDSSFISAESDKTLILWRERVKDKSTKRYDFSGKTLLTVVNDRNSSAMGQIVPLVLDGKELKQYQSDYDLEVMQATGDINSETIPF